MNRHEQSLKYKYLSKLINMAMKTTSFIVCTNCGLNIDFVDDEPTVHYSCGHVEHEDCYFNHHPHNMICLECAVVSSFLLFK